jgi:hypothetical protein
MFTSLSVTPLISEKHFRKGCGTVIAPTKSAGAIQQQKGALMKKRNIGAWFVTLVLAAGLVSFSQAFGAQSQRQNPNQQQQPGAQEQQPSTQQPSQSQPQTYTGKIVKTKTGKYALLTDPQHGKGFFLDNQSEAQKFDQKDVKIVATLDPNTMVLHVINIKPAS